MDYQAIKFILATIKSIPAKTRLTNMRSILIALVFLTAFGGVVSGQGLSEGSFKSQFKKVEGLLYDELYTQALPLAKELYMSDSTNANVTSMLGQAYLGVGDQKKAIYYLEKAVPMVSLMYSESDPKEKKAPGITYYYLAKAYHFDYRFEDAVANYYNYRSFIPMEDIDLYNRIKRDIEMAETASIIYENPVEIEAKNLGPTINTEYPEYSPVISADGSTLIFTSRRKGSTGGKKDADGMFFEDIYVCRNQGGTWSAPVGIGSNINTDKHEASIGLSPDGTKLFIYKSENDAGDIYLSELKDNNWTVPKRLGDGINTKDWETHASINRRGDTIYYVSDMKGGIGGRDIYYSVLLPNGEWSRGRNLGSTINTELDEEAPFISFDGSELIFSSKGHNSMGGFDIFTSAWDGSSWSTPVNIGYPINSPKDDIFFVTTPDGKYAYYSSQMEGGYGEKDLYLINLKFKEKEVLNVTVMQGEIKVSGSPNAISDASIVVTDMATGDMEGMYKPRPDNGRYIFILEPGKSYRVTYSCMNYPPIEETIKVPKDSRYAEINKVVLIDPVNFGGPALAKEEEPKEEVLPVEEEIVADVSEEVETKEEYTETDLALKEAEEALKKQEDAATALALKEEQERKDKEAAALAKKQEEEKKAETARLEEEKKEQEERELAEAKKQEEEKKALAQTSKVDTKAIAALDGKIADAEDCKATKTKEADKVAQEKSPIAQKVSDLEHKWKSADDEAKGLEAEAADAKKSLNESVTEASSASVSPDRKALLEKKNELLKKISSLKTKKANDARTASDAIKADLDLAKADLNKVEAREKKLRQEAEDCGKQIAQLEKQKTEASSLAQAEEDEAAEVAALAKKQEEEKKAETARLEQERKDKEAEEAVLAKKQEEERKAEQARLEQERKDKEAEDAALAKKQEEEDKAEAARLEQERKDKEAAETAKLEAEKKAKEAEAARLAAEKKVKDAEAKLAAETKTSESQSFTIDQIKKDYEAQLTEKKKEIAELKEQLGKKDAIIAEKDAIIKEKDAAIVAAEKRAKTAEANLRVMEETRETEKKVAQASGDSEMREMTQMMIEENRELKQKMNSIEDKLIELLERDPSVYNETYVDPANANMSKERPVMTNLDELKSGKAIVLKNIFFDYNKANIKDNSRMELERLAKFLNANPSVKLEISGHTDSWGNDEYNLRLSNSRAQAVVEYLVTKGGIRSSRLMPRGYGEKRPIAANEFPDGTDNPEGRALNRRIELKLLNYKGSDVQVEKIEVPQGMKPKS